MGNLKLINPQFVQWASEKIVFSVNFFNKKSLMKYRMNTISVGMDQLHATSFFDTFKRVILTNAEFSLLNIE